MKEENFIETDKIERKNLKQASVNPAKLFEALDDFILSISPNACALNASPMSEGWQRNETLLSWWTFPGDVKKQQWPQLSGDFDIMLVCVSEEINDSGRLITIGLCW